MKYYLDTEFLEGTQKKFPFGKTMPTIDLISIGLVDENGREYYAISKDFNLKEAWNRWQQRTGQGDRNNTTPKEYWIRENVLLPIYSDLINRYQLEIQKYRLMDGAPFSIQGFVWTFSYKSMKFLINRYGLTNRLIANDICAFIYGDDCGGSGMSAIEMAMNYEINDEKLKPEFYAYFADYDWVAFCWIFGSMMSLPKGFPMYCRDLKQMIDECAMRMTLEDFRHFTLLRDSKLIAPADIDTLDKRIKILKSGNNYPKNKNEHNALSDANWNKELHWFIYNLK